MAHLYYKHEFVDRLKTHVSDAVRKELNAFAEDTSETASIALRNRIAGMYDLIDVVVQNIDEEEDG